MSDSIISSVNQYLGLEDDDPSYSVEILSLINGAILTLSQLGVCKSIVITKDTMWEDVVSDVDLEASKLYIQLKVKVAFDPPSTSAVLDAMERMIHELEWRLQTQAQEGRVSDE